MEMNLKGYSLHFLHFTLKESKTTHIFSGTLTEAF